LSSLVCASRIGNLMSATNLRDVLAQLRSEKIKERQDGLSSIKAFFAADKVIRNFDAVGDGKAWLVVYQALFTTVALEKKLLTGKKATSTAERRLGDAASFMRSLAERSTQRLNGKVIKALFTHFTQVMVHEGALLPQVSLDYAKAMRSLLAWTPHKDHLDKVQWLSLVEMCFNVILGDEIRKGLDDEDSQESLENEEDEVEEMMSEVGSPKKRRYASAIPTLKSTQEAPAKSRRLVTQEQMEFMAILSLLFQTSSTPLLSPDYSFLPHAIFTRLLRLLRIYSADSSLQHDYLVSLNALLAQLALNCKDIVSTFAASAWDDLVSMWHSKTRGNREVLLSVLLTLYPYYINPLDTDVARVTNGVGKLAGVLAENLESRKGVDCLDMETLHLGLVIHDDTTRSLHRRTFQAATGFDSNNALTWATIMLHADCLAYVSLVPHCVPKTRSRVCSSCQNMVNGDTSRQVESPSAPRSRILRRLCSEILAALQHPPASIASSSFSSTLIVTGQPFPKLSSVRLCRRSSKCSRPRTPRRRMCRSCVSPQPPMPAFLRTGRSSRRQSGTRSGRPQYER
jgi:ataxia telangiectasia mutated family protein